MGNTVIVVEHDTETIESADHIIDLGPEAGNEGGQIVAQGEVVAIDNNFGLRIKKIISSAVRS